MPTFLEEYNNRVAQEKARRVGAGMNANVSDEWLNSLKNEMTSNKLMERADQLSNPNSQYYKSIGAQIRSQLTGAMTPNSLLGLMVAAGGSPVQAQQQIEATRARIGDTTGQLLNQYYLSASNQAQGYMNSYLQNTQYQQNRYDAQEQYKQQKKDAFGSQLLTAGAGILGTVLGGPIGGAIGTGLSSLFGGGGNTQTQSGTNYINSWKPPSNTIAGTGWGADWKQAGFGG